MPKAEFKRASMMRVPGWAYLPSSCGWLFSCLLLTASGLAQTNLTLPKAPPPGPSLRLLEAKNTAFQNNWDLLASKSDVDLATAQRIISKEFPNPVLSLGTSKIDTDRSSATYLGNSFWDRSYDTIAAVSQLFEIGGKRGSRQASAKAGFKAAEARFADARRILNQGIAKAYVQVLLSVANEEILRQSADSLRKEADIAARRLKAGDISVADKSQIEIASQRLELDARAAAAASISARVTLDVLMGVREPKGNWAPADTLEQLAQVELPAPENAKDLPRPDLIAAEAVAQKAEADLRFQKAMR
ncbi:MAG TPA: TolC family protein, partial [Verrucomicrobiae bacterium]|nr:TolC family protein [Verrucomicrobiae bacterium]